MFNTNYSMPANLESIVSKQSDVEKALSTLNAAIDAKKSMQEVGTLEVSAKEAVKALPDMIYQKVALALAAFQQSHIFQGS